MKELTLSTGHVITAIANNAFIVYHTVTLYYPSQGSVRVKDCYETFRWNDINKSNYISKTLC